MVMIPYMMIPSTFPSLFSLSLYNPSTHLYPPKRRRRKRVFRKFFQGRTDILIDNQKSYDLSLTRHPNPLSIDAAKSGNEARFINDYRGVADRPNAEFRELWDERRGERGMEQGRSKPMQDVDELVDA